MPRYIPLNYGEHHFALGAAYGIGPSRFLTYSTSMELRRIAGALGITPEELETYTDDVIGVRIQEDDDDPFGPNVWICLRDNVASHLFGCAYSRLSSLGLNVPASIADTDQPHLLAEFVILHEIAHHVLGHERQCQEYEDEADLWAFDRLSFA